MSRQAVAAIYGGLVGEVVAMIGFLTGMLLESRLQRRGKLRCLVSNWEPTEVTPLGQALCTFEVYLFNESILATGLRDISIVFYQDGERELLCSLKFADVHRSLQTGINKLFFVIGVPVRTPPFRRYDDRGACRATVAGLAAS